MSWDGTHAGDKVRTMHRAVLVGSRALCALGVALAFMSALLVVVRGVAAESMARSSSAGHELPVTTAITTTVRRDIVLLLDSSHSMVEEYDPDAKSYGFARFLVRLLQTFAREGSSVAVMRFAATVSDTLPTGVEPLVDLSPVDLWSRGDFLAVKPGKCPQPGQAGYRVPGRDPCFGTRFAAAFREAGTALRDCASAGPASQCVIVMFTDGDLRDPNDVVDSPEEIAQALKNLPPGVRVYMILFGGRNAAEPSSSGYWKSWREPNGRINDWFFNATTAKRDEVYNAALRMLGMEEILAGLRAVPLPAVGETVVQDLPLNVDRLELNLLPDVEVTETFTASWGMRPADMAAAMTTKPDVDEGTRRIWLAPTFDALTMSLAGEEGVAYYRMVTRTVPVQARVTVWPTEVAVGQPVQVQALVSAGGRVLSDSRKISVKAELERNSQLPISLAVQSDGSWTGLLTADRPGHYTVGVQVHPIPTSLQSTAASLHVRNEPFRKIALRVRPDVQLVGKPIEFEAWPFVGDTRFDLPQNASVEVELEPGSQSYRLYKGPDGSWRTIEKITSPGDYQATVAIALPEWQSASQEPQSVRILQVPELTVTANPSKAEAGQKIDVSVIITASNEVTPTLWQYSGRDWEPVVIQRQSAQHFRGEVVMPKSSHLVIRAGLPALEVSGWVISQSQDRLTIVRNTDLPEGILEMMVLLAEHLAWWLLLFVLVVIAVTLFARWWTRPEHTLIPSLIRATNEREWERLDTLSARNHWREVKALARHITEKIEHDRKLP